MSTAHLANQPVARRKRFTPHPSLSRRNRIGLVMTFLIGLMNVPSILGPSGDQEGSDGPPFAVNALDSVCGIVMVVGCYLGWRAGRRGAIRVAAGASILQALSAVPAFFVDVPAWLQALAGVAFVVSVIGVVLMLSAGERSAAVAD